MGRCKVQFFGGLGVVQVSRGLLRLLLGRALVLAGRLLGDSGFAAGDGWGLLLARWLPRPQWGRRVWSCPAGGELELSRC